jgi:rSAM/selenodomain-associated transferase 1
MRATLFVMVKEPRPGRVKTRLARVLGRIEAAWWFRHQVAALLRRIEDPRWNTVLAVSPDTRRASPVWPAHLPRVPQGRGDLGARMGRLLRDAPRGPVCIIGADIPGITRAHLARAFAALGPADAVLGPAEDGGYWLVGLRRRRGVPREVFPGVRWSTPHALVDTLHAFRGLRVAQTSRLRDVDTAADLATI